MDKSAGSAWKKKTSQTKIVEVNVMQLADSNLHLTLHKPVALFRILLNYKIYRLIACETKRYASQRNKIIYVTQQEIKTFIEILFSAGYNRRPRNHLY